MLVEPLFDCDTEPLGENVAPTVATVADGDRVAEALGDALTESHSEGDAE